MAASKKTGQPIVIRTKMARLMAMARPRPWDPRRQGEPDAGDGRAVGEHLDDDQAGRRNAIDDAQRFRQ